MTCLWSSRHADKHNRRSVGMASVLWFSSWSSWESRPWLFVSQLQRNCVVCALRQKHSLNYALLLCLLPLAMSYMSCVFLPLASATKTIGSCTDGCHVWRLHDSMVKQIFCTAAGSSARVHIVQRGWFGRDMKNKVRKKLCLWKTTFQTGSCQCNLCPTFCQTALALARGILISCSTGVHLNFWDVGAVKRCCAFWDLVSTWPTCVSLQRL
jgi:hypothetical protein